MYITTIKNNKTMKRLVLLILGALLIMSVTSCTQYREGDPIIVKKEVSLVPGYCKYTYEGWGRRDYFEDPCEKYNVGDKLTDTTNEQD